MEILSSLLTSYLNRIGENIITNWYEIRDIHNWMLAEIYRKKKGFPVWKKKVLFSWVSYQKNQKSDPINSAKFYAKKINELFRFFFRIMFPFDPKRLILLGTEGDFARDCDTFFDYEYQMTDEEFGDFIDFKTQSNFPDDVNRLISYNFNIIVTVFGKLLSSILKNDSQIIMLCANVQTTDEGHKMLRFVMVARPLEHKLLKTYLNTMIFHFAEKLPSIPSAFVDQLRKKSDLIYKMAKNEYFETQDIMKSVFFTLQKKCEVLESCTPVLDILNFICSRIEDSVFETEDLVIEIIHQKYTTDPNYTNELLSVFNYINNYASLFSTFQSNNRANIENQFQLFFFYSQYFFGVGLEPNQRTNPLFFPEKMTQQFEDDFFKTPEAEVSFALFSQFLFNGFIQLGNPAFEFAFKKIFNVSIFELNESFFECFLFSLNEKFHAMLAEKQSTQSQMNFDFNEMIHYIITVLYNLVKRVFLAESTYDAMANFRDQIGQYNPDKLALLMLELRIFKDIPFSDNNWQDYFISRNKQNVKNLFSEYYEIPDSYFFSSERLLKINMIYERALLDTTYYLEEWLGQRVLRPFYQFYQEIQSKLPSKFSNDLLNKVINEYFTRSTLEPVLRDHLDEFADFFVSIWPH